MTVGMVPIRLSDVPIHVRQAAARRLMNQEPGLSQEFVLAALCPTGTTYMVDEVEARRVGVTSGDRDTVPSDSDKESSRHRVDPADRPRKSS